LAPSCRSRQRAGRIFVRPWEKTPRKAERRLKNVRVKLRKIQKTEGVKNPDMKSKKRGPSPKRKIIVRRFRGGDTLDGKTSGPSIRGRESFSMRGGKKMGVAHVKRLDRNRKMPSEDSRGHGPEGRKNRNGATGAWYT